MKKQFFKWWVDRIFFHFFILFLLISISSIFSLLLKMKCSDLIYCLIRLFFLQSICQLFMLKLFSLYKHEIFIIFKSRNLVCMLFMKSHIWTIIFLQMKCWIMSYLLMKGFLKLCKRMLRIEIRYLIH